MRFTYDCGFDDPYSWFSYTSWCYGFLVFPRYTELYTDTAAAADPKFYGLWGRLRKGLRFRPIQESRPRNMVLTSNQKIACCNNVHS